MSLRGDVKFQKALALAASASNPHEAAAAELAARRLMATHRIDPTDIPDGSLYNRLSFADNALLKKLREEWRKAHPARAVKRKGVNTKSGGKPKPARTAASTGEPKDGGVNTSPFADFSFADLEKAFGGRSDRSADRHAPGYMRDYMRRRRAQRA